VLRRIDRIGLQPRGSGNREVTPGDRRREAGRQGGLRGRLAEFAADFAPAQLAATIVTGLVTGVILVSLTISLAALVFRGDLAGSLPRRVGLALCGTLVIGIVSVFGSRIPGVIAGVQDNPAAVIGAAGASIAAGVAAEVAVPTVIALIVVTSLLTAAALAGIGLFRLGALVRYIPYPVIGGFLVATGVLILDGARAILFTSPDGAGVLTAVSVARWLPALGLGLLMTLLARHDRGRLALPWVVVSATAVLLVSFAAAGVSQSTAAARNWLLGGPEGGTLWPPNVFRALGDADWSAVAGQWGAVATVIALAAISLMVNVHAIDQTTGQDIDVDHELTVAGISMAAGAPAGMPGYVQLSTTLLLRRLTGPRRGPALLAVLTTGAVLLAGSRMLAYVPTALVGGLLLYVGAALVVEWLWDMRKRLHRIDYALVLGAGAAVVVFGFLPAIALGTVVAIVLFVVRYSRVDAVRHCYDLSVFRSTVERSAEQAQILEAAGSRAVVLEVHGFLFFGTAHRVFNDPRIENIDGSLRCAVFDLARVTGIDSSASVALAKLVRRGAAEGFGVILAGSSDKADELTAQVGDDADAVARFQDLDQAVEWCEELLLADAISTEGGDDGRTAVDRVAEVIGSAELAAIVLGYFDLLEFEAEDVVIEHGRQAPGLFLIETGSLTARLDTADGEHIRLSSMQPGTLVGEISLYLGGRASATVVADGPATVLHLSDAALQQLERSDPVAAAAIHRVAARTLAGRVLHAERALRTLRE
jgi:SulP family sulfate permease